MARGGLTVQVMYPEDHANLMMNTLSHLMQLIPLFITVTVIFMVTGIWGIIPVAVNLKVISHQFKRLGDQEHLVMQSLMEPALIIWVN